MSRAQKKTFALLFMATLLVTLGTACFGAKADATWKGWHVASNGGVYTETDGVITFSGDEHAAGPSLIKEFEPSWILSFTTTIALIK